MLHPFARVSQVTGDFRFFPVGAAQTVVNDQLTLRKRARVTAYFGLSNSRHR